MRRKPGTLLPLEVDILQAAAVAGTRPDEAWLHGYALARVLQDETQGRRLTAHGTLYKALGRLADGGLLEHRWEDPAEALAEGRPRRRLYRITALGQEALSDALAATPAVADRPVPRIAPA